MSELPRGWVHAEIGDLCNLINGRAFKPQEWSESGLPIIRIQNLNNPAAKFNHFSGALDGKHRVRNGDLLFAWSGTPGTSFGAHIWHGGDAALNQHIFKIEFSALEIDRGFLRYAINQKLDELIGSAQGGVGLRHVTKGTFEKTEIAFPPRAEQTRIAAKVDELLAQVDTLKARIDGIPALLKRFRQSVLAAAVSGRLTEEWRSSAQLTPVQALLDEIAAKRSDLKARKLLKASFGCFDSVDGLYPLSCDSWKWVCFDQISKNDNNALKAGPFGSALKKSDCVQAGYKVYGQEQVIAGDERLVTYFIDEGKFQELEACRVGAGDILVSLVGTIGKVLVLSEQAETGIINPRLVKISVHPDVSREYLKLYLDSGVAHGFFKRFSHGGTMEILNLGILKELPIPLPSIAEQTEIVRRVEQLFAFADQLEAKVATAKARIDRLTQSILAKAFRGELVPQDPDDEPASALLERIQAQRASAPKARRKRRVGAD